MFDLGYREAILNSDSVGTIAGATKDDAEIAIEGVLTVDGADGDVTEITYAPSEPAVLGIGELTLASNYVVGDVVSVTIEYSSPANARLSPDSFSYFEKKSFEVKVATTLAEDLVISFALFEDAADIEAGLPFKVEAAAEVATFTFVPGYEGFDFTSITITKVVDATTGIMIMPTTHKATAAEFVITAGSIGMGLGKQIEAEVKNMTFNNIDPYGIQFGGSGIVDVRATYSQLIITTTTQNGWEPHEKRGYGLNSPETVGDRVYILWINEVSAPTLDTAADAFPDAV
ncbi:MAG: hypothetical protein KAH32_06055 [Chlamydiia bacterium]|nr:hypothetical protein [Chlamydiia bacterium]